MARKKNFKPAAALTAIAALLAGCSGQSVSEGATSGETLETMEPVVLTFADLSVENSAIGRAASEYMALVEERTNGKVTFEPYWGGSLFAPTEALPSVESGVADISQFTITYEPERFPVANWFKDTGTLADNSYPETMLQNYGAISEFYRNNEDLRAEFETTDVTPLYLDGSLNFDMICTEEVDNLDSAKGIRARANNDDSAAEIQSMGMTTMFAQSTELYEGLQRGIMDCASIISTYYADTGLLDVAKYYLPLPLSPQVGEGYIINTETLESLPQEVQDILIETTVDWQVAYATEQAKALNEFVEVADEQGVEFIDPRELEAAVLEFQEERIEAMPENAPESLSDPQAFLDDYNATIDKWKAFVAEDMGHEVSGRSAEEIRESYSTPPEEIDWDQYREALQSTLN